MIVGKNIQRQTMLLIWILVCFYQPAFTQQNFKDDLSIFGQYHYGYVLPEYENLTYVVEKPVTAMSINFEKQTRGNSIWEQLYGYPAFGVTAFYTTLGNDKVNGRELAVYPYYNLNIVATRRFRFFHRIGVGFSYVSKKFDESNNLLNVTTGSHFNLHFNSRFGLKYLMTKKIWIHGGLSFDHFSNGNFQEPNLGVNSLTAYAGLGYLVGKQQENIKKAAEPHHRNFHIEFVYSFGGKHMRAFADEIYFTSSFATEIKWELFRVFHVGAGIDFFYDSSTIPELKLRSDHHEKHYAYRTGIHFSQELIYNKLSIILQEGFYIGLTDELYHKTMYNRGIVKYRFHRHLFFSVAMKSHLHILDFAEFGLGYII